MAENVDGNVDDGNWRPVETVGDNSSSSEEEPSPYDGYVALENNVDDKEISGDRRGDDVEDGEEMWPQPTLPALSNRYMPRGTPTSVLAEQVGDDDAPLPAVGGLDAGFDFDQIDFAKVKEIASKIKLKAFEKK